MVLTCIVCAAELPDLPGGGRTDRRFCSTAHRAAWHYRARAALAGSLREILELLEDDADDDAIGELLAEARALAVSAA